MKELCVNCKARPIKIKYKKLCTNCYNRLRENKLHNRNPLNKLPIHKFHELLFVKNYFTHNNWEYHPAIFRLANGSYEPDFYDREKDSWIEVVGSKSSWYANRKRCAKFAAAYPQLNFQVLNVNGEPVNSAFDVIEEKEQRLINN